VALFTLKELTNYLFPNREGKNIGYKTTLNYPKGQNVDVKKRLVFNIENT
jgi:hypothetical protein